MLTMHMPQQNRILAAIAPDTLQRLWPHLRWVAMPAGKILHESGDVLRDVYFPIDSVVSMMSIMKSGQSAEFSAVGNEGLIGMSAVMGGGVAQGRAIVQCPGHAYRMSGASLQDEVDRHGELLPVLMRYAQGLMTLMAQSAICNRQHSAHQQLCQWLLRAHDRLRCDGMAITQEVMGNALGVRRETVTACAGKLQKLGVIEYHRGKVTLLDRCRLEQMSCECYGLVKAEIDRLFPLPAPGWPRLHAGNPLVRARTPADAPIFLQRSAARMAPRAVALR